MPQHWIIDSEWSAYHAIVAQQKGWGLTQRAGMWEIVSLNTNVFATDEAARQHVLACEADPTHPEFTLAMLATNAIVVGGIQG